MAEYVLSCCSPIDLSPEWVERRGVACVFFNYELDGVPCKDDFGATHSPDELYRLMLGGADAKTSQVSVGQYIAHLSPYLEAGKDVLHVTLSSGISGTYGSACLAAEALKDLYPDRRVIVIDSLAACGGYGLLMDKLCDLRDEGMGLDELAAWTEEHRLEVQHWFFSTDLTFFIRGGRISKAAGFMGSLLRICPVMTVCADGSLAVREKVRTKPRATKRVVEIMSQLAKDGLDYSDKVFINNSECLVDAEVVGDAILAAFPNIKGDIVHSPMGATIGCHTGPGTVALFFWGEPRTE